jgi:hypothetical protein
VINKNNIYIYDDIVNINQMILILIKILFYAYILIFVNSINEENEDNPFINKYEWNELIELKDYAKNNKDLKFTSKFHSYLLLYY